MVNVLVIADDLTGCNATGALYSRLGFHAISTSRVESIERFKETANVLLVNSGSRHYDARLAYQVVRAIATTASEEALVVKRVDTTLRGNLGTELDAVLDALEERSASLRLRAVAVPAFPDAGRITVGGAQLVDGQPLDRSDVSHDPFTPVTESRVKALLARQTGRSISEIRIDTIQHGEQAVADAIRARDDDVIVCDATTNAQLRAIAAAVARISREPGTRWVVLDSGPFGAALAAAFAVRQQNLTPGIILAIVGSQTARTCEQLAHAESSVGVCWINLDSARLDVTGTVERLQHEASSGTGVVGVQVTGENHSAERILACLAQIVAHSVDRLPIAGLYASGGEVAARVTSALDAEGFEIEDQLLPLAVGGRLVGGPHDGLPFATKGGLIGAADATSLCLEYLLTARVRRAIRRPATIERSADVTHEKEETT